MRDLIFPLVNPLTPYPPRLCIVLQQSHTLLTVPRHSVDVGTLRLGPVFFLGFQDRSEVGSELWQIKSNATCSSVHRQSDMCHRKGPSAADTLLHTGEPHFSV